VVWWTMYKIASFISMTNQMSDYREDYCNISYSIQTLGDFLDEIHISIQKQCLVDIHDPKRENPLCGPRVIFIHPSL